MSPAIEHGDTVVVNPSLLPTGGKDHVFIQTHFFFNDPAPTEIYPLSLHDAFPIYPRDAARARRLPAHPRRRPRRGALRRPDRDRQSARLNSSHGEISYAVFCL